MLARLLDSAVRRWPAELRDELAREWAAELHALDHEPGVAAPLRRWRQLRFAVSLAVARPPGGPPAPLHWLRQATPAGAQAAWLLAAPVLVALVAAMARILLFAPFGWIIYTPTSVALFALAGNAILAGTAGLVGVLLARRSLRRRSGHPAGLAGCAWAALPVIGGLLALDLLVRAASSDAANPEPVGGGPAVIAALCLVVLLPPVAAAVAALAARRRTLLAVGLAGLGAPVLALAASYAVVRLAFEAPAAADGAPWWWLPYLYREPTFSLSYPGGDLPPVQAVLPVLPGYVLATVVLALAYAVRLARPLPATLAAVPAATPARREPAGVPAVAGSPWWHRAALAGAGFSVVAWAVTLTYLTPNIGVQDSWPSRVAAAQAGNGVVPSPEPAGWPDWSTEEGMVWMHELQLSGIVYAALCLMLAGAYRGRPVLPALAGAVVLLAGNMVVVREGWTTPLLLPWLAAGGLLLGAVAWWAASRRGPGPSSRPRRLVIVVTVLAAFLIPGSFLPRFYVPEGVTAPPVLLLVVVGLPAFLAGLAGMGVRATSRRRRRGPAWRLPAGLALLVAAGGVLFFQDGLHHLLPPGDNPFVILIFAGPVALALPVVVWTAAAIRARPAPAWRRWLRILLTPLLFAAGYPLAMATGQLGMILAGAVLFPMEYGRSSDGIPYVPGAVVVGLLLAGLTAIRLDRTRSEPVPAPATDGFVDLGYARPGPA